MMRRVGLHALIQQPDQELPDAIDLESDQQLLARFGLSRTQLLEDFDASP